MESGDCVLFQREGEVTRAAFETKLRESHVEPRWQFGSQSFPVRFRTEEPQKQLVGQC